MANLSIGGRSSPDLKDFTASEVGGPGTKMVKLTKGTPFVTTHGCPKALWVGTAGTANLVDAEGNTCALFPLFTGRNDISISSLAAGGTADDIWALY